MAAHSPPRILSRLQTNDDWGRLFDSQVDALRLRAFATPDECTELADFVVAHPKVGGYKTAARIQRLGTSLGDVRRQAETDGQDLENAAKMVYSEPDTLQEALAVNHVVSRLIGLICASWRYGLETFSYKGIPAHRIIARRITGGGAEPHADNIANEFPEEPLAASVRVQLGVNIYVEIADAGGELEGWRRRFSHEEYDRLRNPDPQLSYGIRRDAIGAPDWVLKPSMGDVIIFRNSEVHAIQTSEGVRTTWGFFLGYRGDDKPLLIWS